MFSNQALRKLIIPIFLDQLLIIIVGIIATMMVSYAGEAAVSGVSLVDMINMLLINILAALTTGGAVIVSQYIGHKDKGQACNAASQLITISSIISVGITLIVIFFHKPLLQILFGNIEADVMKAAVTYFVLSALSYPVLAIYDSGAALFRSIGNSRVPMCVSIIMNFINLAGNAIGIFILHVGVVSVGASSIIARLIAAIIMVCLCLNKNNEIFISFRQVLYWNGAMIKKILNIAIPNGITNSLVGISISFATAMNLAIVTVVGQCVGAGDYKQADYYTKKIIKITYIGTFCISLAEILLLPWILSLYTLSPEVTRLTYILVTIHNCFAMLLWPVSFTLSNGLRAAGDVRFTMIISISSMFILRISFGYILGIIFNLGVIGIWIAMGGDWLLRSIIYIVRFKGSKWKSFQVI